jgi:hypothetical protein
MSRAKIAIFPKRGQALESAGSERPDKMKHSRLARESAKLDKAEERALAEEQYAGDVFIESEY